MLTAPLWEMSLTANGDVCLLRSTCCSPTGPRWAGVGAWGLDQIPQRRRRERLIKQVTSRRGHILPPDRRRHPPPYHRGWGEEVGCVGGRGGGSVMQRSISLGDRDRCGGAAVKPCSIRDRGSVPLHQTSTWQTTQLLIIVFLINSLSSSVRSLEKCCGEGQGWLLTPGQMSEVLTIQREKGRSIGGIAWAP